MFHFLSRTRKSGFAPKVTRVHRPDRRVRPRLEILEDRTAPAALNLTVTALTDNGPAGGMPGGVGAGNAGDLRYCITQAELAGNAGSTITFQAGLQGTISLQAVLPDLTQNTTITGPGSDQLTVQRDSNAQQAFRIFKNSLATTTEIDGLTIAGGVANNSDGGGILNYGTLTLNGDNIENNQSTGSGGGISNSISANLTLVGTFIASNTCSSRGGGISNFGTLTACCGCVIYNNNAVLDGGGIYNGLGGLINLSDNAEIQANTALRYGGGVYNSGNFNMHGGVISDNVALSPNSLGGGLFNSGTATLDDGVTIGSHNSAFEGSGLYLLNNSTTTLNTVTIQGNDPAAGGGTGIYRRNGASTYNPTNVMDADDPGGVPVQGP